MYRMLYIYMNLSEDPSGSIPKFYYGTHYSTAAGDDTSHPSTSLYCLHLTTDVPYILYLDTTYSWTPRGQFQSSTTALTTRRLPGSYIILSAWNHSHHFTSNCRADDLMSPIDNSILSSQPGTRFITTEVTSKN